MHSFGLTERWWCSPSSPTSSTPSRWRCPDGHTSRTTAGSPSSARASRSSTAPPARRPRASRPSRSSPSTTSTPTRTAARWSSTCAHTPTPAIVEELYLDRLRAGKPMRHAELTRFRLRPGDGRSRANGWPRRRSSCPDQLRALQRAPIPLRLGHRRRRGRWIERIRQGRHRRRNHARVVTSLAAIPASRCSSRAPTAEDEDDGVLLSVVLDADGRTLLPARARRRRPDASSRARRRRTTSRSASTANSREDEQQHLVPQHLGADNKCRRSLSMTTSAPPTPDQTAQSDGAAQRRPARVLRALAWSRRRAEGLPRPLVAPGRPPGVDELEALVAEDIVVRTRRCSARPLTAAASAGQSSSCLPRLPRCPSRRARYALPRDQGTGMALPWRLTGTFTGGCVVGQAFRLKPPLACPPDGRSNRRRRPVRVPRQPDLPPHARLRPVDYDP